MKQDKRPALNWRDILLLLCVAREMTNDVIADRIHRTVKLVEKDLKRIFRALGATTRAGAVHNAWMGGVFRKRG